MRAAASLARREGAATRVLIVDDSAVARAALSRIIDESARFSVAAALGDADRALAYLRGERVDLILLDLDMPRTSGIAALPELIAAGRGARILVVSSTAADGAKATVEALALGAADTLEKPSAGGIAGRFAETLLAKLDALVAEAAPTVVKPRVSAKPAHAFDMIAIGASTGGIHAIASLLREVPEGVRQPILVTQHLPIAFSPFFAGQLALAGRRPCDVATDRARILPGRIVVAPGDAHLAAVALADGTTATRLSTDRAPTSNLPSVDPMLASLADLYRDRLLAVVLSGMGRDGLEGARRVRETGGTVLVQDRETSVVWGMPGAIAAEGLANAVMSPAQIGAFIASLATTAATA